MTTMLNTTKFASLISFITHWANKPMTADVIEQLEKKVYECSTDIPWTIQPNSKGPEEIFRSIRRILVAIQNHQKITAIRDLRELTGAGLLASKECIEIIKNNNDTLEEVAARLDQGGMNGAAAVVRGMKRF